jgi:hypothetical protein
MNKDELIKNRTIYSYYNKSDIDRIKDHMLYLSGVLDQEITILPNWGINSVPTQAEFQILLNNLQLLRNKGQKLSTTPTIPSTSKFNYISANHIEQILYDLELLIDNLEICYKISGTFYSGENLVL